MTDLDKRLKWECRRREKVGRNAPTIQHRQRDGHWVFTNLFAAKRKAAAHMKLRHYQNTSVDYN